MSAHCIRFFQLPVWRNVILCMFSMFCLLNHIALVFFYVITKRAVTACERFRRSMFCRFVNLLVSLIYLSIYFAYWFNSLLLKKFRKSCTVIKIAMIKPPNLNSDWLWLVEQQQKYVLECEPKFDVKFAAFSAFQSWFVTVQIDMNRIFTIFFHPSINIFRADSCWFFID